jgi:hypothetical protein
LARHARLRAKKKTLPFDLDQHLQDLQMRIDRGFCEVSGLSFNLAGGRTWDSPSFDRIDPKKGYLYSNVRVVLHALNGAMGDWGEAKMLEIARAIMARRLHASNELSERLGQNLMQRLDVNGSPEYVLIWRRLVTESGHVIYRLRASARRTSDNACIGWPTPCSQDGPKGGPGQGVDRLPGAARLAGWSTPTSPVITDGHQAGNNRFVTSVVRRLGQTTKSSTAQTEKRGALAPEFSRWLMGFPAEWDACAPTATRSCRQSRRSS